MRRQNDIK